MDSVQITITKAPHIPLPNRPAGCRLGYYQSSHPSEQEQLNVSLTVFYEPATPLETRRSSSCPRAALAAVGFTLGATVMFGLYSLYAEFAGWEADGSHVGALAGAGVAGAAVTAAVVTCGKRLAERCCRVSFD